MLHCLILHHPSIQAFLRNMYHTTKWWEPFEAAFCCWRNTKIFFKLYWKIPDAVNLCFHNLTFPTTPILFLLFDACFQIHIKYNVSFVGVTWKIFENGPYVLQLILLSSQLQFVYRYFATVSHKVKDYCSEVSSVGTASGISSREFVSTSLEARTSLNFSNFLLW